VTESVFQLPTQAGDSKWIGQAHQSAKGWIIAQAAKHHKGVILVTTKNKGILKNDF
jgi:transcription-repair coupling factor (superfamily II helicase)